MDLNFFYNISSKKRIMLSTLLLLTIISFIIVVIIINYKFKNDSLEIIYWQKNSDQNSNLVVELKNEKILFCALGNSKKETKNLVWIKAKDNKCILSPEKNQNYLYLKDQKNMIKVINYNKNINPGIYNFEFEENMMYIPTGSEETIDFNLKYMGNIDNSIKWSISDETVASVDNGTIKAIKNGSAIISAETTNGIKQTLNLKVSDLFTDYTINNKKKMLPCKKYSLEQAQELDNILAYYVNKAGKKTRAGVVAAGRFLTMQFSYKILYLGEAGRLSRRPLVDGEGRYYHEGLYLSTDKYKDIVASKYGPKIWGCDLNGHGYNGLDCSGFISWVVLNGGFDVGDIGAGSTPAYDFTDVGIKTTISKELIESEKVKAGDLIGIGGHIAIILGIDKDNYYIGESLFEGVALSTVSKKELLKKKLFKYIMLMDTYYKDNGNYTAMWK